MSATLEPQRRHAIRARAIRYVRSKFGNVADLPGEVISVVWVTAFRGIETAVAVEEAGGQSGLLKNKLLGEGSLGRDLEVATEKMTHFDQDDFNHSVRHVARRASGGLFAARRYPQMGHSGCGRHVDHRPRPRAKPREG